MSSETTFKCWAAKTPGFTLEPFEYVPRPLGDNDIEIKVTCCGICGSDLHTISGEWGTPDLPVVVGHEIVGEVVKKGNSVSTLELGDLVGVGAQVYACGQPDCNACSRGFDPHCSKRVYTYNDKYVDGGKAYGGYSEGVRVDEHYAFRIPKEISPAEAAPLMCAGTTVFTPMLSHGFKKGDRVGVIGIGGLGHLALQFASKLGCVVTAFSHSSNKRQECLDFGAHNFVDTHDPEALKKCERSLDYLIITSNSSSNDYEQFGSWVDFHGKIILLAAPPAKISLAPNFFISTEVFLGGSLIGGIKQIKETLAFAAKHNIRPVIQKVPMSECNRGVQMVHTGNVRYRVVLEN
ncbi:hypothetical protein BB560_006671 [Smittium megazygosporum]|uniref:Enoyl reductase (ER) domain-containing protein n=1 Tax=Smittium megazygosporum TaxID=133381 RepID=A0A2T9XYP9_9FUNG|nr:hypothetical protein BB560_007125 [Smittium megazygosporum]PVU86549.1 hypothetical protein BB560_006671 [Smittium megazygosporum]